VLVLNRKEVIRITRIATIEGKNAILQLAQIKFNTTFAAVGGRLGTCR